MNILNSGDLRSTTGDLRSVPHGLSGIFGILNGIPGLPGGSGITGRSGAFQRVSGRIRGLRSLQKKNHETFRKAPEMPWDVPETSIIPLKHGLDIIKGPGVAAQIVI